MSGDEVYVRHILESISAIEAYLVGGTREVLEHDRRTRAAVVRELEIIGEAATHLSPEFQTAHPDVPLDKMIGMRNKLIHEYFGVDIDVVWKTAVEDLPVLKQSLEGVLSF